MYGTAISFALNDPNLVFQRKQHARFVDPITPGGLNAPQRWTDTYSLNVYVNLFNGDPGTGVDAPNLTPGTEYRIAFVGTTNFTTVGAASNTIGVVFTATAAATGTGVCDTGNFVMVVNAYAESVGATEDVQFSAKTTIRRIGPMFAPA